MRFGDFPEIEKKPVYIRKRGRRVIKRKGNSPESRKKL